MRFMSTYLREAHVTRVRVNEALTGVGEATVERRRRRRWRQSDDCGGGGPSRGGTSAAIRLRGPDDTGCCGGDRRAVSPPWRCRDAKHRARACCVTVVDGDNPPMRFDKNIPKKKNYKRKIT